MVPPIKNCRLGFSHPGLKYIEYIEIMGHKALKDPNVRKKCR
jgi:hypothetical protein